MTNPKSSASGLGKSSNVKAVGVGLLEERKIGVSSEPLFRWVSYPPLTELEI